MSRVESNKDQFQRALRERLEAGLRFSAIKAREIAAEELSVAYPPASTVGQYPRRRTGQLVDSLRDGFDPARLVAWYGVHGAEPQYKPNTHAGGIHWVYLMAAGRLGLERPVIDNLPELRAAFRNGVASVESF